MCVSKACIKLYWCVCHFITKVLVIFDTAEIDLVLWFTLVVNFTDSAVQTVTDKQTVIVSVICLYILPKHWVSVIWVYEFHDVCFICS